MPLIKCVKLFVFHEFATENFITTLINLLRNLSTSLLMALVVHTNIFRIMYNNKIKQLVPQTIRNINNISLNIFKYII